MADSVIVDDRDSSFVYSPLASWLARGVSNELDGTTHDTATPGATATITFSGTSVQVFGTIDVLGDPNNPNNPVSTYSIDGSTNVTYTGQRTTIIQYRVQFFHSPTLKPGEHTLVITNTVNHGRIILDYIQFVSNPTTTVTTSTLTTSTGLSTTTTSSSTVSQSPEVASPHSVNISTGALIGAVIGAVTALFIMVFFIWCLRRRLTKLKRSIEPANQQQVMTSYNAAGITPFTRAIRTDEAASLSTPFSTAGGSAIRGGTSREKFVPHSASESTPFQSSSAVGVTHPLIGQNFGGLYSDHIQNTHADAPPSYHFGSPTGINHEGD